MQYEKLLEQAYEKLPEAGKSSGRFELPKVRSRVEGNKTVVENFSQVCSDLRRESQHVMKFLLRELAASGSLVGKRLIIVGKVSQEKINSKLEAYVKEFVLCPECHKPDTELVKKQRLLFIHCLACGAEHPVRAKIH